MQHLGVFMKDTPDSVATVLAHHGAALCFGVGLDGVADVAESCAGTNLGDPPQHAVVTDVSNAFCLNRWFSDEEHLAGVAMKTVLDDRNIDIDKVTLLERFITRNAMADDMVDGGANRLRKALVVERCGYGLLLIHDKVVANPVQGACGHARLDVRGDHFQHFGRQSAGDAHFFDFVRCFDRNGHSHEIFVEIRGFAWPVTLPDLPVTCAVSGQSSRFPSIAADRENMV